MFFVLPPVATLLYALRVGSWEPCARWSTTKAGACNLRDDIADACPGHERSRRTLGGQVDQPKERRGLDSEVQSAVTPECSLVTTYASC